MDDIARLLVFCLKLGYTEREFWKMTPLKIEKLIKASTYLEGPPEQQSIRDILQM